MRLHRFYINEKNFSGKSGIVKLGATQEFSIESAELINQIRRVFRLKSGDSVILFDGSGFDFVCEIVDRPFNSKAAKKDAISFRIKSSERSHYMPECEVYLCVAITKKDSFEWIVEKATELGVTHIVPIQAERSEKKSLNFERLNKIAVEASEQSGRGDVPNILPISTLEECFDFGKIGVRIAFHTEGEAYAGGRHDKAVGAKKFADPVAIFIGPEGGWSPTEIELFKMKSVDVKSLGSQVFRVETAVIVALSKVLV